MFFILILASCSKKDNLSKSDSKENSRIDTEVKIPEQQKIVDPRSKTSIRGKNYIAKGDENSAKVAKARPAKVTWY